MLKDEMKLLAQLTDEFLSGIRTNELPATDYQNEQEARINSECQRIKKVWTDVLFSQANDQVIKRYTWFQQQIILELADRIYQPIEKRRKTVFQETYPVLKLAVFLLEHLLELKDFQIQYFNSYINGDGKIPDAAIPAVRKKMSDVAEELSSSLQNVEMDAHLKACIRDYLDDIIAIDAIYPISYRSAEYLIQLAENLSVTIAFEGNRDLTHSITEVLFYLNFNHQSFCQWYQEDLINKKTMLRTSDQLQMLMKQLLVLKSIPVILKMSYDPKILPVNLQLENWLNEYIKNENYQVDQLKIDQPQKIELKLTVAQLTLLIRLLYEEDVFAMKNIAALLRFFSDHFMSKKQEHISHGSMNKLYYSGDQFTGYAVREILLKMIDKINKMFFPI